MKRRTYVQSLACIAMAMLLSARAIHAQSVTIIGSADDQRVQLQTKKPSSDEKRREAEAEKQREKKQKEFDRKREAEEAKRTQPKTFELPEQGLKYTSVAGWMQVEGSGTNVAHILIFREKRKPAAAGAKDEPKPAAPTSMFVLRVSAVPAEQTLDAFAKEFESQLNCHNTFEFEPAETASMDGVEARILTAKSKPEDPKPSRQRCLIGIRDGKGYIFNLTAAPDAFDGLLDGVKRMESSIKWLSKGATTKPSNGGQS